MRDIQCYVNYNGIMNKQIREQKRRREGRRRWEEEREGRRRGEEEREGRRRERGGGERGEEERGGGERGRRREREEGGILTRSVANLRKDTNSFFEHCKLTATMLYTALDENRTISSDEMTMACHLETRLASIMSLPALVTYSYSNTIQYNTNSNTIHTIPYSYSNTIQYNTNSNTIHTIPYSYSNIQYNYMLSTAIQYNTIYL